MDEAEDVSRLTSAAYLCYQDGGPRNGAPADSLLPVPLQPPPPAARLKGPDQHLGLERL